MKKKVKEFFQILLIIILFLGISLIFQNSDLEEVISSNGVEVDVSAEAAIVMECNSKRILYQKNAHKILPPASLTKVLTAVVALENIDLTQYYLMEQEFVNIEGSKIYLEEFDLILGYDLLYGLLLRSGNECANALAHIYSGNSQDFIIKMNECAKLIGMNDSIFVNPSGLDEDVSNYTSAYDLALLMSYALENEEFRKITKTKKHSVKLPGGKEILMLNKHKLVQSNYLTTGGKTGFTKKAGRTLITSFKKGGMEIVVVTLNASNDWQIHELLSEEVFRQYEYKQVMTKLDFYLSTLKYGKFNVKQSALKIPLLKGEIPQLAFILEEDEESKKSLLKISVVVNNEVICYLEIAGEAYE